jgi:hypothetical protein
LEHRFLLKKEKRELYRDILKGFVEIKEAVTGEDHVSVEASVSKIEGLAFEAELISDHQTVDAILSVASHFRLLDQEFGALRVDYEYLLSRDKEKAQEKLEQLYALVNQTGYFNGAITTLMKLDLEQTVFPFGMKRSRRNNSIRGLKNKVTEKQKDFHNSQELAKD